MLSEFKIPNHFITYPLEFTCIIAKKKSKKQHVRKNLCPCEMLWVKLIMLFQPEHNIKTE